MSTATMAHYEAIERPENLWGGRGGQFYRIVPVKGAKAQGIISVGMTSQCVTDSYGPGGRPVQVSAPVMWVDLSPARMDHHGKCGSEREALVINGKTYDARFGARVEFLPAAANDHRSQYYPLLTVGHRRYVVDVRFDSWDAFTDAARKVLTDVLLAIAMEYVTGERWHGQRVKDAEYKVERAQADFDSASEKLAVAQDRLVTVKAEK